MLALSAVRELTMKAVVLFARIAAILSAGKLKIFS